MKVDFLGAYSQVRKLLEPRSAERVGQDQSHPFGALLRDVTPLSSKTDSRAISNSYHVSGERQSFEVTSDQEESPRARFSLPATAPRGPELSRMAVHEPPVEVVTATAPRVKSLTAPTIVAATRTVQSSPHPRAVPTVAGVIKSASAAHGVDASLSLAVAKAESSLNPRAISGDGFQSKGLFQLLDTTGNYLLKKFSESGAVSSTPYAPFDPTQNAMLGVGYLRYLTDLFQSASDLGDATTAPAANSSSLEKLAVAAFNAGEGRVASAQQRAKREGKNPGEYEHVAPYLPDSTRTYVSKVLDERAQIKSEEIG